ncbi:MAG TPA: SBBP repeat-containing protein, partial [Candidatus Sulfotelmatobacter sp.]|nr:SBBP repeat-containing protein [Candidatus Sulfotelmatobacter sp.]
MRRISFGINALIVSGFAAWFATTALAQPVITSQPQSVTATEGAEILLRVAAEGTGPLAYQWQHNSTPIPGATEAWLRLTNAGPASAGAYRVRITDDPGAITSAVATVILQPPPGFLWSRGGGTRGTGAGRSVVTDAAGHVYQVGYFSGTATFGTSNLVCTGTHFFVARYDAAGELVWVRQGGGAGEARANGVALDAVGNVLVTGSFTGVADFGGVTLTSAGLEDVFTAKYDPAGNLLWARRFGDFGSDQANGVAADGSGNVWVTGSFNYTVTFGTTSLTSYGGKDVFVAMYDGSGNAVWAKRAGGTEADEAQAVGVDSAGNCYIAGYFYDVAYFDTETVTVMAQVNKTSDLFVAKYRGDGSLVWVRQAGGVWSESANALALDGGGNLLLAGKFFYTATFGNLSVTASGGGYPEDFFVA